MSLYRGHDSKSSEWVPSPITLPWSSTRILSASMTVPMRWATMIDVLPAASLLRADLSSLSVL